MQDYTLLKNIFYMVSFEMKYKNTPSEHEGKALLLQGLQY